LIVALAMLPVTPETALAMKPGMHLESLRQEYLSEGLGREHLAADPLEQFGEWMRQALELQVPDPTAMVPLRGNIPKIRAGPVEVTSTKRLISKRPAFTPWW